MVEISAVEQNIEKRMKRNEDSLGDLWNNINYANICITGVQVKEDSEQVGLKLNIRKTKIMASGPTTSWQIDGETVSEFIFLGSKITENGDCSHEIKRRLLLGRKA